MLHAARLDLDSDPAAVALAAQRWCGHGDPSPATYNQRRAILGSFYTYGIRQHLLTTNPLARVERRAVDAYGSAQPLDRADLAARLAAIDRTTLPGARDYALLAIYVQTGRRLVEVADLRWQDVALSSQTITLTFRRCKGGKTMRDALPAAVSRALLAWLTLAYGDLRQLLPDAALWLNLAANGGRRALGTDGIRDICVSRLGISKVHALRHTFAHAMQDAGAPISEIQARLGHASLDTTGRYLAALSKAENSQAQTLAALFGID